MKKELKDLLKETGKVERSDFKAVLCIYVEDLNEN